MNYQRIVQILKEVYAYLSLWHRDQQIKNRNCLVKRVKIALTLLNLFR